ncbi:hypothetical protein K0T92_11705 [Paenibacillus oenotherae]|uniref:Fibronectin type-III domain-containing protein n=1 Tax=Paenibacillus oenotherae TaxID=1435645 RepID=A0ABS7D648_9BACL|nr:carbohydrate binding domain-containing protein [Paenibacillus oenotherae]MBW7475415.1 hypothetical protein [Paenibacillus oenotherae]
MMVKSRLVSLVVVALLLLSSIASFEAAPVQAKGESNEVPIKYPDEIVVKFKSGIDIPLQNEADPQVSPQGNTEPGIALEAFPELKFNRLFNLAGDAGGNARGIESSITVLDLYYTAPVPENGDAEELIQSLSASHYVEEAYLKPQPVEPPTIVLLPNTTPVQSGNDPNFSLQGYANAAPQGHDAPYAWQYEGGDGKGISWVDVEQGWALNHEDLTAHGIVMLPGSLNAAYHSHGTGVLGVVSAVDNTIGNLGITSKATPMVSSQHRSAGGYSTSGAIISAADALQAGDVILLEAQTSYSTASGYVPVEVYPDTFDAIRYAVDRGITVIEAAGNGSVNLDTFQTTDGKFVLNRTSPDYKESGAIMVGAVSNTAPHTRMYFSNYGSRIDVNSWGMSVHTLDAASSSSTTGYQSGFSGTSSASSIITANAISIQGIAKAEFGTAYSTTQLRALLSNSTLNTPSSNPATDKVGYMPNLKNIIDNLPVPFVDTVAPSQPANFISPSKTSTTISLAWDASTSFTDTGLTPGTAYTYTVKAVDAANNKSLPASLSISTNSGNTVTVYYKQGYSTPYIHYRPAGGTWTTAPGVAMPASEVPGYNKYTVNVGSATGLEAVFNNGSGTWDNNGGSNYIFPVGTSTFNAGTITSGVPVNNTVTIYYKRGFSTPYIHWRPEGGTWTAVPGVAMANSEVAGYSKITLSIGSAARAEVCFNNGSGTWDSNGGSNYMFNTGTSTYDSGTITSGTP